LIGFANNLTEMNRVNTTSLSDEIVNSHVSWEEMCAVPGRCGRERIVAEQSHDKSGVALGTPARHDLAFRKRLNLPRNVQNSSHEASKFTVMLPIRKEVSHLFSIAVEDLMYRLDIGGQAVAPHAAPQGRKAVAVFDCMQGIAPIPGAVLSTVLLRYRWKRKERNLTRTFFRSKGCSVSKLNTPVCCTDSACHRDDPRRCKNCSTGPRSCGRSGRNPPWSLMNTTRVP
jgi:hypothetical protein